MTWVTDDRGTRWVEPVPRKRRKPARALRFAQLQAGDVLIHRAKWKRTVHAHDAQSLATANDNGRDEVGVATGLAICTDRWFDPVAGQDDPVAGEMAAVRAITNRGVAPRKWPHTLRGLAMQGYSPTTPAQAAHVNAFLREREQLIAAFDTGTMTQDEVRAAATPWRTLMRELEIEP